MDVRWVSSAISIEDERVREQLGRWTRRSDLRRMDDAARLMIEARITATWAQSIGCCRSPRSAPTSSGVSGDDP
jgi:hypothetical protein